MNAAACSGSSPSLSLARTAAPAAIRACTAAAAAISALWLEAATCSGSRPSVVFARTSAPASTKARTAAITAEGSGLLDTAHWQCSGLPPSPLSLALASAPASKAAWMVARHSSLLGSSTASKRVACSGGSGGGGGCARQPPTQVSGQRPFPAGWQRWETLARGNTTTGPRPPQPRLVLLPTQPSSAPDRGHCCQNACEGEAALPRYINRRGTVPPTCAARPPPPSLLLLRAACSLLKNKGQACCRWVVHKDAMSSYMKRVS